MRTLFAAIVCTLLFLNAHNGAQAAERPNILFISVDDMNCDSVGVYQCRLKDTTPNIDRLAAQGIRFEYAHVQVGNCMPCRNVLFSGRYPHNNKVEGFYQVRNPDYPVLAQLMQQAGYLTAIRGKVSHSTPYTPFAWDLVLDEINGRKLHIKDVESYYLSARNGIKAAVHAEKPFCMLINVSDPHKPFYGMTSSQKVVNDPNKPSRIFRPDEVPIPGFLFDHPDIRLELAHYYSSVRRADDCVGAALKALDESGQARNTVVVFLSDHGMPLPFAKTALYHHSTRTPWIVRWPDVVTPGSHDTTHMISGVDLLPTLLDIAGIPHPDGLDGRSFLPLLKGESQTGRDMVFKEYNENAGGNRNPMRGTQTKRFGYLFNPWVNGTRTFKTATTGTLSFRAMKQMAASDPQIAQRLNVFLYGEREQFFDYQNDPDALHNLIDDPRYQEEIDRHRKALENWMIQTNDHALEAFQNRNNPTVVESYIARVEAESAARRNSRKKKLTPSRSRTKVLQKITARTSRDRRTITITVQYNLPEKTGSQKLHVTLKDANGRRIARKVLQITGNGAADISFAVPAGNATEFAAAAFVGPDYEHHLQHIVLKQISVR